MVTDILQDTEISSTEPHRPPETAGGGRWLARGLLIGGLLVIVTTALAMMPSSEAPDENSPRLTHTVKRGDLVVSVTESGTLESSDNVEIKCQVRGRNTVTYVVESGTYVYPGDLLVQLDTLFIEEQIDERTKYALWSRSGAESSAAKVVAATLAVSAYEQGKYIADLMTLEKDLAIAEATLVTARNMLNHEQSLWERGYRSQQDVVQAQNGLLRAEYSVGLKQTEIEVLKKFTRRELLESLKGDLKAIKANHKANVERAEADASRRDRAVTEHGHCEIKADREGLVIYPSAAAWKNAPDIELGATVHKDQILLLMPDMKKMQVKVGIHESLIDRVEAGLEARVTISGRILESEVEEVASVAQPAGWWTGNVVKYDTAVRLPSVDGLKPGMSAEVEVILARHENVLTVPVTAVVESERGTFCWAMVDGKPKRKAVTVGDANDVFVMIEAGLDEGDEVVLNPMAFVEEAQSEVLKPQTDNSKDVKEVPPADPKSREVWPPKPAPKS